MRKFRLATIGLAAVVALLAGSFTIVSPAAAATAAERRIVAADTLTNLTTWWHGGRGDNYSSGTFAGDGSARNAGYAAIRYEAFVWTTQVSGTKPLYLHWHNGRQDNFTTATQAGINSAVAAGYNPHPSRGLRDSSLNVR